MLQSLFCCEWHYALALIFAFMVIVLVAVLTMLIIIKEAIILIKEEHNEKK